MVLRFLVPVALMVLLYAGCGPSPVDKVNKLVNDGNVFLQRSNVATEKADGLRNDLFGENLAKNADIAKYKSENKEKFEAAADAHREAARLLASAAESYESAAGLASDEKLNEYLMLRSREFRRLSATYADTTEFVARFLSEDNEKKIAEMVGQNGERERAAVAAAADLRERAERVVRENPAAFLNH